VPQTSPNVRASMNDDGAVLLDIEQGICFSLNPSGATIWKGLSAGQTRNEIAESLKKTFEIVPDARIIEDLDSFLEELRKKGLYE